MDNKRTIYLDYQATTPTDPEVLKAMLPYFSEKFGNHHSRDHEVGWDAAKEVEVAAANVAKMIGTDAEEIRFPSGATDANNLAPPDFAINYKWEKGKRIVATKQET